MRDAVARSNRTWLASDSDLPSARTPFGFLRRNTGFLIFVTFAGTFLSGIAAYSAAPRYTANALLLVDSGQVYRPGTKSSAEGPDDPTIETEISLLTSDDSIRYVLRQLQQDQTFFQSDTTPFAPVRKWLAETGCAVMAYLESACSAASSPPGVLDFKRGLSVVQDRRSHLISVTYTGPNRQKVAEAANTLVQAHSERRDAMKKAPLLEAIAWIDRKLPDARDLADASRKAYYEYQAESDLDGNEFESRKLADLRRQLSQLTAESDRDAIAEIDPVQVEEARRLAMLQVSVLQERLSAAELAADSRILRRSHLDGLRTEMEAASKRVEGLERRRKEFSEELDLVQPNLKVVSLARSPEKPSSLDPLLLVLAGSMSFFILGVGVSVYSERMDETFRSQRDVANTLGVPCVGLVPIRPRLRRDGRFDWAIQLLYMKLHDLEESAGPTIILVTSSVAREVAVRSRERLRNASQRIGQRCSSTAAAPKPGKKPRWPSMSSQLLQSRPRAFSRTPFPDQRCLTTS